MKEHSVNVKQVTTKYHHKFTAFVENFNGVIFKIQGVQELNDPSKDSSTWFKYLNKTVSNLNRRKLKRLGMTPAKVVKLEEALDLNPQQHAKQLPEDGLFQYLLQPGEEHGDEKRWVTNKNWSKEAYRLKEIVENARKRVLYYLAVGAPQRSFVRGEFLLISEETEVPPDWVRDW